MKTNNKQTQKIAGLEPGKEYKMNLFNYKDGKMPSKESLQSQIQELARDRNRQGEGNGSNGACWGSCVGFKGVATEGVGSSC